MPATKTWTEDRERQLEQLWPTAMTAGEIAEKLGVGRLNPAAAVQKHVSYRRLDGSWPTELDARRGEAFKIARDVSVDEARRRTAIVPGGTDPRPVAAAMEISIAAPEAQAGESPELGPDRAGRTREDAGSPVPDRPRAHEVYVELRLDAARLRRLLRSLGGAYVPLTGGMYVVGVRATLDAAGARGDGP